MYVSSTRPSSSTSSVSTWFGDSALWMNHDQLVQAMIPLFVRVCCLSSYSLFTAVLFLSPLRAYCIPGHQVCVTVVLQLVVLLHTLFLYPIFRMPVSCFCTANRERIKIYTTSTAAVVPYHVTVFTRKVEHVCISNLRATQLEGQI